MLVKGSGASLQDLLMSALISLTFIKSSVWERNPMRKNNHNADGKVRYFLSIYLARLAYARGWSASPCRLESFCSLTWFGVLRLVHRFRPLCLLVRGLEALAMKCFLSSRMVPGFDLRICVLYVGYDGSNRIWLVLFVEHLVHILTLPSRVGNLLVLFGSPMEG